MVEMKLNENRQKRGSNKEPSRKEAMKSRGREGGKRAHHMGFILVFLVFPGERGSAGSGPEAR